MHVRLIKKFGDKVKKFCAPLKELGINHFYYHRITHTGHFANVALYRDWIDYYFFENLHLLTPCLRDPKCLEGGLGLLQALQDPGMEKVLLAGKEKYNCNLGLHIIHKTEEGVDGFGFGLPSSDVFRHIALFNHLPLLRHFISCFKKEFKQLSSAFTEEQCDLASLIGPTFYQPANKSLDRSRTNFLRSMGVSMEVPLKSRDIEVIEGLHKGYSASKMADELHLSKRTIEHRLERLKEKLDCSSKAELIQKTKTLESLGYF
jgi:DNA-binding CsgD family transcriptional regulator